MKDISGLSAEKMKDGIPDAILPIPPLFVVRCSPSTVKIIRSKELMYINIEGTLVVPFYKTMLAHRMRSVCLLTHRRKKFV